MVDLEIDNFFPILEDLDDKIEDLEDEVAINAKPKLLEPTNELIVKVPEDMVGNVMTDLQSRRALIQGFENQDNYQILKCLVPAAELYGYSTDLRSLTQGKATFSSKFSSYELVPANVQSELIKEEEEV